MANIRAVCALCGEHGIVWRKLIKTPSILQHHLLGHQSQIRACSTKLTDKQTNVPQNATSNRKSDTMATRASPEKYEVHFKKTSSPDAVLNDDPVPMGVVTMPHPIWTEKELKKVEVTHRPPQGIVDKMAFYSVKVMRKSFDIFTLFNFGERTERKWILRICFLETVAGVPGMVAAMTRHLHSLRRMQRDYGWIHTLLEEAENERMHLMTALQLRQPSWLFRASVLVAQGVFVNLFALAYLMSPRFCHRFVGYLEEEAVYTYTKCLQDIESGSMQHWKTRPAPEVAITYWKLPPTATMKDVILAIRADEAHHRQVNHTFASMKEDQFNPYKPGK